MPKNTLKKSMKVMKENKIKRLINGIFIVLLLLCICATVDYADTVDEIVVTDNQTQEKVSGNLTMVKDGVYFDNSRKDLGVAKLQNVVVEKSELPIITMTGRPSCSRCARNHIPYKWFTRSYINYCPNCHNWRCLGNKHKRGAVHENEITCFNCDSDFCVYDGHEKYSWSKAYLRKA